MPNPTTFEQIKGMSLNAVELKSMTNWPDAIIEDYLNIIRGLIKIAELLDIEIDQKIEEIPTDFADGSIPFADNGFLIEDVEILWNNLTKLLSVSSIGTKFIDLNLDPGASPSEGRLYWDKDEGTASLGMPGGNVNLQIGQEIHLPRAKAIGSDILNGQVVYLYGASGQKPEISLAKADAIATSECTIAVATETISQNSLGYVTAFGLVRGIDTSLLTEGQPIYLSAAVSGALTSTAPSSPNYIVRVGTCIYTHATSGIIFVNIRNITRDYKNNYGMTATRIPYADANGFLTEKSTLTFTAATDRARIDGGVVVGSGGESVFYHSTNSYIKTDNVAASDLHITTGAAKTVVYDTAIWEDLNFDPTRSGGPAATRPDDVTINNVIHKEFTSSNNQLCGANQEVPHNYKLSSSLYPHCHIFLKSGESAGTTGVTFTFYWELRQSTGTTSGSVTLSATSAQLGTTAGANKLDLYDASFSGPSELGAQLAATIARTAGNAGDVIVTTYGVHYEKDTPGSRQITAK